MADEPGGAFDRYMRSIEPKESPHRVAHVLGVATGVVFTLLVGFTLRYYLKQAFLPTVPDDIATRPWVEEIVGPASIALDVPWPLVHVEPELPEEIARTVADEYNIGKKADGLLIAVSAVRYEPVNPGTLDDAALGALMIHSQLAKLQKVTGRRREIHVLGERAVQFFQQQKDVSIIGVVFERGDRTVTVQMAAPAKAPAVRAVWERLLGSIRERDCPAERHPVS